MKKVFMGFLVTLTVATGLVIFTNNIIQAESDSSVSRKLDEILNNQKSILSGIDSLKEELNIVKIRITQQQ